MRYRRVYLEEIGYVLPDEVLSSSEIESKLEEILAHLHLGKGNLEALTGIKERRVWPPSVRMGECAYSAAKRVFEVRPDTLKQIGAVVYGGVCRDALEPANAAYVASRLGISGAVDVSDVANACLGVMTGIVSVANQIELGQIKAGIVVSAESSRHIITKTIAELNRSKSIESLKLSLAALTGGSGAVAVLLCDESLSIRKRKLVGGVIESDPDQYGLCQWGPVSGLLGETESTTRTDASNLLKYGVALGERAFSRFLHHIEWQKENIDRVVTHQMGGPHRTAMLKALSLNPESDYATVEKLGNMGSCALPISFAKGLEAGFIEEKHRVAMLGIGSGLSTVMLGVSP